MLPHTPHLALFLSVQIRVWFSCHSGREEISTEKSPADGLVVDRITLYSAKTYFFRSFGIPLRDPCVYPNKKNEWLEEKVREGERRNGRRKMESREKVQKEGNLKSVLWFGDASTWPVEPARKVFLSFFLAAAFLFSFFFFFSLNCRVFAERVNEKKREKQRRKGKGDEIKSFPREVKYKYAIQLRISSLLRSVVGFHISNFFE